MKITVKKIMSWEPCSKYTESRVKELIVEGKTPLEVCDLKISVNDIFWVLFRNEIIPENDLHELACKFAEQALKAERKAGREPHADSWKAIKVKRQWLKGKASDKQLAAAKSAAWSAAKSAVWAAAESAVGSAAWAAAWSAAKSAVESAAWAAAESAVESAAKSAVESAARAAQLKIVKKYFKEAQI